ncbi:MAG: DNA repair protein RadC [Bacteroidales bacterium]|nr:DNA repair protein RadC [Bacteroidales bacterium]
MKIKELTEGERPRERMMKYGPEVLGTGELLAILLRSGTRGESAVDLAQRLLALAGGSLVQLSQIPLERLRARRGLGGAKVLPVLAALELGRRFISEESRLEKIPVVAPAQVYRMMKPVMKGLQTEECWVIYLNSARYVIGRECVSSGGLNATILDVKRIVASALERRAQSVVLVHNHPSGNPRPGSEDLNQTLALRRAMDSMSISLLDHVVLCDDSYYSFADEIVYKG